MAPSQWASTIRFLNEFRHSSALQSTADDKKLKELLAELELTHGPPIETTTRRLFLAPWSGNSNDTWANALNLGQTFTTSELNALIGPCGYGNTTLVEKKIFDMSDMLKLMRILLKDDSLPGPWDRHLTNDEKNTIAAAWGRMSFPSCSISTYTARGAYDVVCVVRQGVIVRSKK